MSRAVPGSREDRPELPGDGWRLLTLTAADPEALETEARKLAGALADQPDLPVARLADTLARRPVHPYRLALAARSAPEAGEALLGAGGARVTGVVHRPDRPVVLLYPGVGEHHPGMVADLYRAVPEFRSALDTCRELIRGETGVDSVAPFVADPPVPPGPAPDDRPARSPGSLRSASAPGPGPTPPRFDLGKLLDQPARPDWLDEPGTAQLAVFAVGYALTAVLRRAGLELDALLGYSIGEYVAAVVAGVIRLDHAVSVLARRAALITATRQGGMLAVLMGPEEATRRLRPIDPELVVSAVDGPKLCVVSGPAGAVDALQRHLTEEGIASRRIPSRYAFHSPLLAPAEGPLSDLISGYPLRPPATPMLSNVTGTWLDPERATSAGYWARHLSSSVRYADNLAAVWRLPDPLLVEAGPGQGLATLARTHPGRPSGAEVVPLLPTPAEPGTGLPGLLLAIGGMWTLGLPVDPTRITG